MEGYKLLIVNHAVEIGGAERVLLRFLSRLDRQIFRPALACPFRGPLVEEAEGLGVRIHLGFPSSRLLQVRRKTLGGNPLAILAYPLDFLRTVHGLARLIGREGYDLVLTNSAKADIYGSLAGWLARRPVVWRLHDIADRRAFSRLNLTLFRVFAGLFTDRVLAVSEAVERALVELGIRREKVAVVYNGVEEVRPLRGREEVRKEWGLPPDAPVAGMVGRLVDWKGPDLFIAAAAEVAREVPEARFLLVGDAIFGEREYVESLREMVGERGLGGRLVFTGFREDVPEVMGALDLLVHASLLPDPLPTVLLEAMCLGLPVVAADGGGVPEIVEDGVTGVVVPPGDVKSLARAMSWMLVNPRRRREMGEAGRKRAVERFGLEERCRELEGELLGVLRRRGVGGRTPGE